MEQLVIGFCLDETGSMGTILTQTIDGFNEYIETMKNDGVDATLTLTMFSDQSATAPTFREFCKATPLDQVEKLTTSNYRPNGGTPLYDAIANTIRSLEAQLDAMGHNPTVAFVIQTDGHENSSREFSREQVFDLIRKKESEGWKFTYLGADQDGYAAEAAATMMGMSAGSSMGYNKDATGSTYSSLASAHSVLSVKPGMTSAEVADDLKQKLVEEESKKKSPSSSTP